MNKKNMQARILKWQSLARDRGLSLQQLDEFKNESIQREAKKRSEEQVVELFEKIPLRYRDKTWADFNVDNCDQAKIKAIIECYVRTMADRLRDGNNIVFFGKSGTGKTLLSLIIYQKLVQGGFSCCYEPSLDFLRTLQEKKFVSVSVFSNAITHYKQVPFLIIDEVTEGSGKEGSLTDWERSLLFKLIDARYQQKSCTLIISNRTQAEIRTRLSEPTFGRLLHKGISLAFNWNSYR